MPDLVTIVAKRAALRAPEVTIDQKGLTSVPGPGSTPLGELAAAVRFGPAARAVISRAPRPVDADRYALRIVFAARGPVSARQNLVEGTGTPIAVWLEPDGADPGYFRAFAAIQLASGTWRTADPGYALPIDEWHTLALVVDGDVVLLVHEEIGVIGATAAPDGPYARGAGDVLALGTGPDGTAHRFRGDLAAVVWTDELPSELDALADAWRLSAAGVIDAKRWSLLPGIDVGPPRSDVEFDSASGCRLRRFANATIFFSEAVGLAFEIHGAIRDRYFGMPDRSLLGYPVSDEIPAGAKGVRKSLFSHGGIYWAKATGAHPVQDEIYLAYETMGEAARLGTPKAAEQRIAKGLRQRFSGGELYISDSSDTAFEVHGAILARFLETGGTATWGFPTGNETAVMSAGVTWPIEISPQEIGRVSQFERGAFYWSRRTGARVVYGAIRTHYERRAGGAAGALGFPTSDEQDLPGAGGGRCNTFEHGTIIHRSGKGETTLAPLAVRIGTVDSQEDEGFGRGQNDLTIDVELQRDGVRVDGFRDATDGQNIVRLNRPLATLIEPAPGRVYTLKVVVRERDPEDDQHLGTWTKVLDANTLWGLEDNNGVLRSGAFDRINGIDASVGAASAPPGGWQTRQRDWGLLNPSTAEVSRTAYAKAFVDVDSDAEWWDAADAIERIYYELVVKGVSAGGNCVGLSAGAALAEKGMSIYQMPLDTFTMADWPNGLEEYANINHQCQVSARAVWWFLGMCLNGYTHDPKKVFELTHEAYRTGRDPIICLAQNYDFSGAPHAVRPIDWVKKPGGWDITVLDPNLDPKLKGIQVIRVFPDSNTFRYEGQDTYHGGEWTGGRLYFLPFDAFAEPKTLPVWDVARLVVGGTLVILGSAESPTSVQDTDGENLLLTSQPEGAPLQTRRNGFVAVPSHRRKVGPDVFQPGEVSPHREGAGLFSGDASSPLLARALRPPAARSRGSRGKKVPAVVGGVDKATPERQTPDGGEGKTHGAYVDFGEIDFGERKTAKVIGRRDGAASGAFVKIGRIDVGAAKAEGIVGDAAVALHRAAAGGGLRNSVVLTRAVDIGEKSTVTPSSVHDRLLSFAASLSGKDQELVIAAIEQKEPPEYFTTPDFIGGLSPVVGGEIGQIIAELTDEDFVLDTETTAAGGGIIAISHGLRHYIVRHGSAVGARLNLRGEKLRTAANLLTVRPDTERPVAVTVTSRIGVQGDYLRAAFIGLPSAHAAPVALSVRPGIARWDIAGAALDGRVEAQLSGILGGRRIRLAYDVALGPALRLQLPATRDAARLTVMTTAGLFAEPVATMKIEPR